jgi:hypothetical protein
VKNWWNRTMNWRRRLHNLESITPEESSEEDSGYFKLKVLARRSPVDLGETSRAFAPLTRQPWQSSRTQTSISSTISKDNTCGEDARRAELLAEFGRRRKSCVAPISLAQEDVIAGDSIDPLFADGYDTQEDTTKDEERRNITMAAMRKSTMSKARPLEKTNISNRSYTINETSSSTMMLPPADHLAYPSPVQPDEGGRGRDSGSRLKKTVEYSSDSEPDSPAYRKTPRYSRSPPPRQRAKPISSSDIYPSAHGTHHTPSRYARYESVRLENDRPRSRSPVYVKVGPQPGQYRELSPGAQPLHQELVYRTRAP